MSKFIHGLNLLTRFDIVSFELFDYVKNGLQPFDKFGRPIPPRTIKSKLERLKKLNEELKVLPLVYGKIETLHRGPAREEEKQKCDSRHKSLLSEIETLKRELDNIENKHSWSNYELPEDKKSAEWVFDSLLRSYFRMKDVEAIEKASKKDQLVDQGTDKETKLEDVKEYIDKYLADRVPKEKIAVELKDTYNLSFLQIGRSLNLNEGLHSGQIDALKQRGQRLHIKGLEIIAEEKKGRKATKG